MDVEYFARWIWSEGRGVEPLTPKRVARLHDKRTTYVAYLASDRVVLTLRPETKFAGLGFLTPSAKALGGVALILGDTAMIESISVWQHGEEVVRLQGVLVPRSPSPQRVSTNRLSSTPGRFPPSPFRDLVIKRN